MAQREFIPNQVFIGLPWKNVKAKYENAVDRLVISSPLSFVIIGRSDDQDAEDLLVVIKEKLENSSYAIFDATWGNANVSLEYGYAEAKNIPRALYLSIHRAANKVKDAAIISDLAGKKRNTYAREDGLLKLLNTFSSKHTYTKRFEKALLREYQDLPRGNKKRLRSLALKIIHRLDGESAMRREDIIQSLLADTVSYEQVEIERTIRNMYKLRLVYVERGRYPRVSIA